MYEKKLDSLDVYKFAKGFYKEYDQMPSVGFLAGYFKVSKRTIYNKLVLLEKNKHIARVKKNKYNTTFELKK